MALAEAEEDGKRGAERKAAIFLSSRFVGSKWAVGIINF